LFIALILEGNEVWNPISVLWQLCP